MTAKATLVTTQLDYFTIRCKTVLSKATVGFLLHLVQLVVHCKGTDKNV